jgi:hypothetical protein
MIETLLKVNIPSVTDYEYLPHEQGVYFARLTKPEEGYGPYYSQWDDTGINTIRLVIGSVTVNQSLYVRKSSLADCEADDGSFFWDNPNQTIYIHFVFDLIPEVSTVVLGIQGGYSFIGTKESIYIDDVEFLPLIQSVPNIKKKVDAFQVGKMKFQDQSITLKNGDAQLDDFIQNPIPGSEGSIVLFDTSDSSELEYYTGLVTSDKSTIDTLSIKLQDKRRRENIKVPRTRFDTTTYPDIESKYVGKIIPEGYGDLVRITAFPTNGDESPTPTNISFKYATDATVLTSVEVKDDDVWTTVTGSVLNSVPSTGSFDLPYATATNASGAVLDCVVTATLRAEENPGDVIADMNDRYNSVNFDATNYNLTEWASEKAKLADIALYMNKHQEFFKWVEMVQNGSDLFFVYDIEGDGTRTLRVNDPNRTLIRSITAPEIKNDLKPVERDFSEFSSTVTVLYNKDWEADNESRIEVDTFEEAVIEKYLFPQDSEFDSLLPATSDAQTKADVIAEDQQDARPVATVVLHEDQLTGLTLKLYDVVTVDLSKPASRYWQDVADSTTFTADATDSITFTADATDSITFTPGEMITRNDGRDYWGTIRGQILGIEYNPTDLSYTLTIRERPVSEVI